METKGSTIPYNWIRVISALLAILVIGSYSFEMTENCLTCICARNDCAGRIGKNATDGVCGPFYISKQYYEDCDRPGTDYLSCTKEMECSKQCVRRFMAKYAENCTYPRQPRCKDCSRMHWSGSKEGCRTLDKSLQEQTLQLSNIPLQECCELIGNCDN